MIQYTINELVSGHRAPLEKGLWCSLGHIGNGKAYLNEYQISKPTKYYTYMFVYTHSNNLEN